MSFIHAIGNAKHCFGISSYLCVCVYVCVCVCVLYVCVVCIYVCKPGKGEKMKITF